MGGALLITLREGLEAALIIGIILAFLKNTGSHHLFKYIWQGTGVAVAASAVAGGILFATVGSFEGAAEQIFEGFTMLLAAGVITWMIFWMRKQAYNIKAELHNKVQVAVTNGSTMALIGLAFVAVVREGIETALFLFAASREEGSTISVVAGGVIGLVISVAIGYTLYRGTAKLNLKTFFNITGGLLILFAAGLVAYGIHELQEAGLVPIIIEHVWDINHILPEKETFGRFLGALFGYNGNPSLIEVITYFVYLVSIPTLFFKSRSMKLVAAVS